MILLSFLSKYIDNSCVPEAENTYYENNVINIPTVDFGKKITYTFLYYFIAAKKFQRFLEQVRDFQLFIKQTSFSMVMLILKANLVNTLNFGSRFHQTIGNEIP